MKKVSLSKCLYFFVIVCFHSYCSIPSQKEMEDCFCSTCEYDAVQAIFQYDSISTKYRDYTNLDSIKECLVPIRANYLDTLNTAKYLNDKSITQIFNSSCFLGYAEAINSNSRINSGVYKGLAINLYSLEKLQEMISHDKGLKYLAISKPIFSSDRTFALIELDIICYGLCGEGNTYVLEKKANKWQVIKKVFRWVS